MSGIFGSGGGSASSNASANTTQGDLSKDIALTQPPEDSVSHIRWSPANYHLAVASWDKKVRIYEVSNDGQSQGKAMFEHEGPALSCCWSRVSQHMPRK